MGAKFTRGVPDEIIRQQNKQRGNHQSAVEVGSEDTIQRELLQDDADIPLLQSLYSKNTEYENLE